MRKFLHVLLFACLAGAGHSQTTFPDYADGYIYARVKTPGLRSLLAGDPKDIPLSRLKTLAPVFSSYSVTRISRPFFQAGDDEALSAVLKIRFAKTELVEDLISELKASGLVDYAEKVPLMKTHNTPNDPSFPQHLTQINATSAWNIFSGSSDIPVAVVDDAVMWNHTDLQANIYINPGEIAGNNIDDDNNGYVDDVHGWDAADGDNDPAPTNLGMMHGTHCAGIAGAVTNNGTGVASIGWNIRIIPVKCEPDNGSTTNVSYGYEGVIYAAHAHARIISLSWGGNSSITGQAVINYAWARGCLIIASAGNANTSAPAYPAAYNNVYSVASVDNGDVHSSFSNYGSWVDIAAPGENVNSTIPYSGTPAYTQLSGTSMAAPLVAGLGGLMLSKCPYLTASDLINCISSSAVNIYSNAGNSSYASQLGAGRIDAYQAMLCAAGYLNKPPVANFGAFPASSCSNTPIQFSDSSLYQPTSWQWTFQGGTPATSTASNPAVQWSAPGTYSVSLMVTNANGSDTKTRLSYITIAAPNAVPVLNEGFQSAAFLPAGWTVKDIGNDGIYWMRKANLGAFGTSTACAVFDNFLYYVAGDRDEMLSPRIDFGNTAQAHLRFDVAYAQYDNYASDTLEVKLSTDCGTSWQTIYLQGGQTLATAANTSNHFTPTNGQWRTDSIDISSTVSGQHSVMFSFINHGQYGQPIYLDNINLAYQTPTMEVTAPDQICAGAAITFTNSSSGAGAYSWTMAGANPDTSALSNPVITYSAQGTYTVNVTGVNGTETEDYTMVLLVNEVPTVSLNASYPTCSACSDGAIAAQVSGGSNITYTWEPTGGNSATASGLTSDCYTVIVSNAGCINTATACIDFPTGVAAIKGDADLSIYPNPAGDRLYVELDAPFTYRLYDVTGKQVQGNELQQQNYIDLHNCAKGLYLLEIEQATGLFRKKIIKD